MNQIHPADQQVLDELTLPKHWDYPQFRKILIALGVVGKGTAIPGRNRPESIHIQGLRKYIDDLFGRAKGTGKEHARAILVDKDKQELVMGKVTKGLAHEVRLDISREPGREKYQVLAASIHIHSTAPGLSGQDYRTFLNDKNQQAMMIGFGDQSLLLTLKTSVTPNSLTVTDADRRIRSIESDYLNDAETSPLLRLANFNKAVCAEMGLVLYMGTKDNRDLMTRVNVTQ